MFSIFREQEDPQDQFRFGREADGSPAKPWARAIWIDMARLNRAAATKGHCGGRTVE